MRKQRGRLLELYETCLGSARLGLKTKNEFDNSQSLLADSSVLCTEVEDWSLPVQRCIVFEFCCRSLDALWVS